MRVVLQRVSSAAVSIDGREVGRIDRGVLVFVGIGRHDDAGDIEYVVGKIRNLRLFEDVDGKMNLSVADVGGEVLLVSQFTLYGDCRKGRRPSFDRAAPPAEARALYERLVEAMEATGVTVRTGEFQAMMDVALVNDGPVTLLVDSDEVRKA